MNARDELLNLHRPLVEDARQQPEYHDNTVTAIYGYSEGVEHALDTVWAKGYRKPRTITTAEELEALPLGSSVLCRGDATGEGGGDQVLVRSRSQYGYNMVMRNHWLAYSPGALIHDYVTITVLHEPTPEATR